MENLLGKEGDMKSLAVTNSVVSRQRLLELAEATPGAWMGIRIAAILLILKGWNSSQVAELFDLSRWSVVKWIQRVNKEGAQALEERSRPGRPHRLDSKVQEDLENALSRDPRDYGLKRNRWDGIVVVEYLQKIHGVHLKVRQAQRWIRRLGFSLRQPIYRYVQATSEGVEEFRGTVKKTPRIQKKCRKEDDALCG
jgi:transposase